MLEIAYRCRSFFLVASRAPGLNKIVENEDSAVAKAVPLSQRGGSVEVRERFFSRSGRLLESKVSRLKQGFRPIEGLRRIDRYDLDDLT